MAKAKYGILVMEALGKYVRANKGNLPTYMEQVIPYLHELKHPFLTEAPAVNPEIHSEIFRRYTLVARGNVSELSRDEQASLLVENTSPDEEKDQRIVLGPAGMKSRDFRDFTFETSRVMERFLASNPLSTPQSAVELLPYFQPPLSPQRAQWFINEFKGPGQK